MKHLVSYQREVDKGKLTAVEFSLPWSFCSNKGLTLQASALSNSVWRLIYMNQI